jgi:hypothetical protein
MCARIPSFTQDFTRNVYGLLPTRAGVFGLAVWSVLHWPLRNEHFACRKQSFATHFLLFFMIIFGTKSHPEKVVKPLSEEQVDGGSGILQLEKHSEKGKREKGKGKREKGKGKREKGIYYFHATHCHTPPFMTQ